MQPFPNSPPQDGGILLDAFFMSDGATFSWFAFFMNGTHGEMTRFSGNAIPMREEMPGQMEGPGRLLRFSFLH